MQYKEKKIVIATMVMATLMFLTNVIPSVVYAQGNTSAKTDLQLQKDQLSAEENNNTIVEDTNEIQMVAKTAKDFIPESVSRSALQTNPELSGNCGATDTDHVKWQLTQNSEDTYTLTISGTGAMKDYSYEAGTRPWDHYNTKITSITMKKGVTTIGNFAFYNLPVLADVEISDSVKSYGNSSFSLCKQLKANIKISKNVEKFGPHAFVGTPIQGYSVESGNKYFKVENGILYTLNGKTLVSCPQTKEGTFNTNWLANVETIAAGAFRECKKLTGELIIPDSVRNIEAQAFQNCSGLTGDLTIPNTINSDLSNTFYGCSNLNGVLTISNHISEIGTSAFNRCNFSSIVWGKNISVIGTNAFSNNTKLKSVTIPNTVKVIKKQAFHKNIALQDVTLSDNLQTIGEAVFRESGVKHITIPADVKNISKHAFYQCSQLQTVYISDGIKSIGEYAFAECDSLTNAFIPSTIDTFGTLSFAPTNGVGLTRIFYTGKLKADFIGLNGNVYGNGNSIIWGNLNGGKIKVSDLKQNNLINPVKDESMFTKWTISDGYPNAGNDLIGTAQTGVSYTSNWIQSSYIITDRVDFGIAEYGKTASKDFTVSTTSGKATVKSVTSSNENVFSVISDNAKITVIPAKGLKVATYEETLIVTTGDGATHEVEVLLTVEKAIPSYIEPTGLTASEGQTLADVKFSDSHFTWIDSTLSVGRHGQNMFTAIYTPDDTSNFKIVEVQVLITVIIQPLPDNNTASVETKDNTNTIMWGALLGLSTVGGAFILKTRKKRN